MVRRNTFYKNVKGKYMCFFAILWRFEEFLTVSQITVSRLTLLRQARLESHIRAQFFQKCC